MKHEIAKQYVPIITVTYDESYVLSSSCMDYSGITEASLSSRQATELSAAVGGVLSARTFQ